MSNQIKNLKYTNITLSQTVDRFKAAKKKFLTETTSKIKESIQVHKKVKILLCLLNLKKIIKIKLIYQNQIIILYKICLISRNKIP